MALSLGLRPNDMINVAGSYLKVVSINTDREFAVCKCSDLGKTVGKPLLVTDTKSVEVMDGVSIIAGVGSDTLARIAITAPRHMSISRIPNLFVTKEALAQWDELYPALKIGSLRKRLLQAKPIGSSDWRGNDGLFFRIHGSYVIEVSDKQPVLGGCTICNGLQYTEMFDDFEHKVVQVPCHNCLS